MFLCNYLDDIYYNLLIETYDSEYLNSLDEVNFIRVYEIFKKNGFYFINDIIVKYLEIFEKDAEIIEKEIYLLKEKLGEDFINIISKDLRYLKNLELIEN